MPKMTYFSNKSSKIAKR